LNGHSNNRNSTTVGQNNGRIITDSEIDPRTNRLRIPGPEPTVKPEPITKQISEEDKNALASLLSEATAEKLIDLDQKVQARKQIPSDERSVVFDPIMDRSQRAVVHQVGACSIHGTRETLLTRSLGNPAYLREPS